MLATIVVENGDNSRRERSIVAVATSRLGD